MPRLSLVNWLYYAHDELPLKAKTAFETSTFTDKLLVAHARASRISYRFTELRKSTKTDLHASETEYIDGGDPSSRSQRCIKGNVLVMPQDSTDLITVLPPPPEAIRDTVCAVFVGKSRPSRDTIGRFGPLLVKKSRLITIIDFLTDENAHFACDTEFHGISHGNINELFGPGTEGDDEGIPCGLDIGFIDDSDSIRSATADYTDRNSHMSNYLSPNSDLLMDNVGYTLGNEAPKSYREMKMQALSHCLAGGKFIRSQGGERFIPDFQNPSLLTWLFPHLDPWGIGGFHEPARTVQITMEEQLKYLLELDDNRFERDPNFAFVYYNILQKKAVFDSVHFKVKLADQTKIVRQLLNVDRTELERLIDKFKANPRYEPQTTDQKQLLSLVNKVGTMLHNLPGTASYKLKMRNEIRSLVNMRGTPAFFITLNPSDVNHPLIRLLAGHDIDLERLEAGQELSEWDRRLVVANNPAACAKFFHEMISKFISIILRYGKHERGLFGKCTAYYGTVETQGRGTLHCHMLIWLKGHPSPQEMRDNMQNSAQYQADLFVWLESLIKCELLGTSMVVTENGKPLEAPDLSKVPGYIHPGTHLGPRIDNIPSDQFKMRFASDVNDIVSHTNWHQHMDTCWKYLSRGEPHTDENCRMRIDGATREQTTIDDETGSILLRRHHPRIANYNDLIIFLLCANMELKHIGSGEGSKALIYYITDYITKASLPAHVGLAALLYAINRMHEKFKHEPNWEETKHRGALTVLVNSMMGRQEIPHQQVMSYLVGGGDHYKSEMFRVLHYGSFERLVMRHWVSDELDEPNNETVNRAAVEESDRASEVAVESSDQNNNNVNITEDCIESLRRGDDSVTLILGAGSISAVNQLQDYLYRPFDDPFDAMCLYEYIGLTEKVTKNAENQRELRKQPGPLTSEAKGRPKEPRGVFSPEHPQHRTHIMRCRTLWVVPILLGDRILRPDRGEEEREHWARTILTLFVPWRHPSDLKEEGQTWFNAYQWHSPHIPKKHHTIIHNMNILSECKDARDKASLTRKLTHSLNADIPVGPPKPDAFDVYSSSINHTDTVHNEGKLHEDEDAKQRPLIGELDDAVGPRFWCAIDSYFTEKGTLTQTSDDYGTPVLLTQSIQTHLEMDRATMRRLKRKRRPDDNNYEHVHDSDRNTRPRLDRPATIGTMSIGRGNSQAGTSYQGSYFNDPFDLVYQVILEKNLRSNPKQLRAFELVARHAIKGAHQLLMYVGGVGGTGKSHVVHSILQLFHLLGISKTIRVAAPTGAAAILIGGHTIHSLTLLPDSPGKDLQELSNIWEGVNYLILDEISMIGGRFLSQLSSRLQHTRGYDDSAGNAPFGGLNIIFTGDFGQLRPVKDPPLYSHSLVHHPELQDCGRIGGISALMGVFLWRTVSKVVLLKINQRQAGDKTYADLLTRVRIGEVRTTNTESSPSDFNVLRTRYADQIAADIHTRTQFADSPIIVGKRRLRDLLNLRVMGHHARNLKGKVELYHARDKIAGDPVTEPESTRLWAIPSSITNDSLGKLPLFPGMKVMVQENLAFTNGIVNGTEGTVRNIIYEEIDGKRYATVVYVHIPGSGSICANAENDIVPIFPERTTFPASRKVNGEDSKVSVSRLQLPLLPSYTYTDYKSQGRSLDTAIVDPASATALQGVCYAL